MKQPSRRGRALAHNEKKQQAAQGRLFGQLPPKLCSGQESSNSYFLGGKAPICAQGEVPSAPHALRPDLPCDAQPSTAWLRSDGTAQGLAQPHLGQKCAAEDFCNPISSLKPTDRDSSSRGTIPNEPSSP